MVRHILQLPKEKDECVVKGELIAGEIVRSMQETG
jgi:hypothetical protein